jgi:hypothetical protein
MKRPQSHLLIGGKKHPNSEQKAATPRNGVIKFTCKYCASRSVFLISLLPCGEAGSLKRLHLFFFLTNSSRNPFPIHRPHPKIKKQPDTFLSQEAGTPNARLYGGARLRSHADTERVPLPPPARLEEESGLNNELRRGLSRPPQPPPPLIFSFPCKFLRVISTPTEPKVS